MRSEPGFKSFEGVYNALTNVIIVAAVTALVAMFQIIPSLKNSCTCEKVLIVAIIIFYLAGLCLYLFGLTKSLWLYAKEGELAENKEPRIINKEAARWSISAVVCFMLAIILEVISILIIFL